MNAQRALEIVGRQRPCGHESGGERLGTGAWFRCDDCGRTVAVDRLDWAKAAAAEFDAAMDALRAASTSTDALP